VLLKISFLVAFLKIKCSFFKIISEKESNKDLGFLIRQPKHYLCTMNTKHHSNNLLLNLGIESLNEMQEVAQDAIVNDNNVLLLSPTGSGKTLAFLLPIFELLQPEILSVQCLILIPSRELGLQIEQVWKKMGTDYKVNACYGGHSIDTEIKNLSNPPAVLIGTPGRIADHIDRGTFRLDKIQTLVLDEFDKSLQLGFHEQMSVSYTHLTLPTK
jgi:ATP-dependent RNA helicase DeaD